MCHLRRTRKKRPLRTITLTVHRNGSFGGIANYVLPAPRLPRIPRQDAYSRGQDHHGSSRQPRHSKRSTAVIKPVRNEQSYREATENNVSQEEGQVRPRRSHPNENQPKNCADSEKDDSRADETTLLDRTRQEPKSD